jgi:large-conductance mechanosensitive channel
MFEDWLKNITPQRLISIQNLKKFMINNNVISTMVGVIVAYSAWDLIQSAVGDVILPGIYFLFFQRFFSNSEFISSMFEPVNRLNFPRFTKQLFSFLIVIFVTYLFIQHIVENWIGIVQPSTASGSSTVANKPTVFPYVKG